MLFNKVNNYNKITVRLYPNGTVKGFYDCSLDFDDGKKTIEKYNKLCEKYKKLSLNAQSNTSENSSLTNDTLKITIFVGVYAFAAFAACKTEAGFDSHRLYSLRR